MASLEFWLNTDVRHLRAETAGKPAGYTKKTQCNPYYATLVRFSLSRRLDDRTEKAAAHCHISRERVPSPGRAMPPPRNRAAADFEYGS
ncbi:MAG TPA: hypothetical protein VLJ39_17920, partial [Tepidisphaeraceae bacterium]|nr:hypothetical protein [Tepidisphaeraceae bacterium]